MGLGVTAPQTVVVAEDEFVTRAGVVHLLGSAGFRIVAEAGDLAGLLAAVREHRPDVVITDVRMPPTRTTEGLDAAETILRECPGTAVVVLSQVADPEPLLSLLGRGTVGYLLKERVMTADALVAAVGRVLAGQCVIDPDVVAATLARRRRLDPLAGLTARERAVLALLAEGLSNEGIASRLYLSERTIEVHVGALLGKLGIEADAATNRRVLAVLAYLRAAG